jgi:DNA mismatch repair protein MutL
VLQWRPSPVQPVLIPEAEQQSLRRDWSPMLTPRAVEEAPAVSPTPPEEKVDPLPFRVLHPLGADYWLMESADGLVVLNPAAAWERILFEETRARAAAGGAATQALLAPLAVTLSPREHDLLRPHLEKLRLMGLGVEDFGGNTVMLHSLPPGCTGDGDPHALLSALIDELQKAGDRAPRHRLDDDALAAAVARQAARLERPAGAAEITNLLRRLLTCEMPYCCPAGQPTIILFSYQELARKFGKR